MTTKKLAIGWLLLVALLASLFFVAERASASTSGTDRSDIDSNTTSPFLYEKQPIQFNTVVQVDDECIDSPELGDVGYRFKIMSNAGIVDEIASGVGGQTISGATKSFDAGTYQPHIYYWTEFADHENLEEACSSADVFDPFEILEAENPTATSTVTLSTDPVQNVLLAAIVMLMSAMYVRRVFFS